MHNSQIIVHANHEAASELSSTLSCGFIMEELLLLLFILIVPTAASLGNISLIGHFTITGDSSKAK